MFIKEKMDDALQALVFLHKEGINRDSLDALTETVLHDRDYKRGMPPIEIVRLAKAEEHEIFDMTLEGTPDRNTRSFRKIRAALALGQKLLDSHVGLGKENRNKIIDIALHHSLDTEISLAEFTMYHAGKRPGGRGAA